jgi:hypothetical protein
MTDPDFAAIEQTHAGMANQSGASHLRAGVG